MLKKRLGAEGLERNWSQDRKTLAYYFKTYKVEFNFDLIDFTLAHYNDNSLKMNIREAIITGTKPLPDFALSHCINLRKATFRNSIEEIPYGCFRWCYKLKEVIIPEGVWGISVSAFEDCWNLRKVVIPESVEWIGYGAFAGCEKAEVILRKSVKDIDIGTKAFEGCKKIRYYRKRRK